MDVRQRRRMFFPWRFFLLRFATTAPLLTLLLVLLHCCSSASATSSSATSDAAVEGLLLGKHVCRHQERYLVNVTRSIPRTMTVRTYSWCASIPPRCSKYTQKIVYESKVEEEARFRTVEQCCEGYQVDQQSNTCVSICPQDCNNGDCTPHGCICRPGFNGTLCNEVCSATRWGRNCRYVCLCERGSCDSKSGHCSCPSGWKGERCEERCSWGYFGDGCSQHCNCGQYRSCDYITGACKNDSSSSENVRHRQPHTPNNLTTVQTIGDISADQDSVTRPTYFIGNRSVPYGSPSPTTSGEFDRSFEWIPIGPELDPTTKPPQLTKYYSFDFAPSTSTTEASAPSITIPASEMHEDEKVDASQIKNLTINSVTKPLPYYTTSTTTTKASMADNRTVTSLRNLTRASEGENVSEEEMFDEEEEGLEVTNSGNEWPERALSPRTTQGNNNVFATDSKQEANSQTVTVAPSSSPTGMTTRNASAAAATTATTKRSVSDDQINVQPASITERKEHTVKAKVFSNEVTAGPSLPMPHHEEDSVVVSFGTARNGGGSSQSRDVQDGVQLDDGSEQFVPADRGIFDKRLLSSIGITAGVTVAFIVIAIAIIVVSEKHKRRRNDKTPGVSPRTTASVSVITHSTFHAPLPEINFPHFENPVFTTPIEGAQDFEKSTFSTHVICSMDFYRENTLNGQIESLYDHPPARGSYRAASVPDPDENQNPPEPLYDEIPCWKVPVVPESPIQTTFQHPNYMNTFKS